MGSQDGTEPVGEFVVDDFPFAEEGEHLAVELSFWNAVAGMVGFVVTGTAVIDVGAFASFGGLGLPLAGDRVS